jgi:hypothetical protein
LRKRTKTLNTPGRDPTNAVLLGKNLKRGNHPAGIEQPRSSRRKTRAQGSGDVRSDVADRRTAKAPSQIDPEALADLASRLAALPPEALAALQAIFGSPPR